MLGRFATQTPCRLMAHGRKDVGSFLIFGKIVGNIMLERVQISGSLKTLQAFFDFCQLGRQLFGFNPVFPRHPHQFTHTLFLCRQFIGVDVTVSCHIAHIGTDFAQFGLDACQHIQALGKARLDVLQIGQ